MCQQNVPKYVLALCPQVLSEQCHHHITAILPKTESPWKPVIKASLIYKESLSHKDSHSWFSWFYPCFCFVQIVTSCRFLSKIWALVIVFCLLLFYFLLASKLSDMVLSDCSFKDMAIFMSLFYLRAYDGPYHLMNHTHTAQHPEPPVIWICCICPAVPPFWFINKRLHKTWLRRPTSLGVRGR